MGFSCRANYFSRNEQIIQFKKYLYLMSAIEVNRPQQFSKGNDSECINLQFIFQAEYLYQFLSLKYIYSKQPLIKKYVIFPIYIFKITLMKKRVYFLLMAFTIQILKVLQLSRRKRYYNKMASLIQQLDILSIVDLKNKVKNGIYKIGDFVLSSGKIQNPEKVKSILEPKGIVAYSKLIMDKTLQIGLQKSSIRKTIRKTHPSFLRLFDKQGNFINIFETFQTKILTYNFFQKMHFHKQNIFNLGWIISLFIQTPTRLVSTIFTQNFIPQNSEVVVVGRISEQSIPQNLISNVRKQPNLYFVKPEFIAPSKSYLLSYTNEVLHSIKFQLFLYGMLLTFTAYCFIRTVIPQILKYIKNRKKISQDNAFDKAYLRKLKCEKCSNNLSSIISYNCRHMAICQECYNNDELGQNIICAICLRKGNGIVKVFPC